MAETLLEMAKALVLAQIVVVYRVGRRKRTVMVPHCSSWGS